MPMIPFDTDFFPAGTVANGSSQLNVTWGEILWAAMTVGRPSRHYVFQHGQVSQYEALFRLSLVRMALEQRGPGARRLRRTAAAKTLDPSEKGAVNYFLGLTFCKLFASRLLNTPWLLHLDVFRPFLNPILTGRSRPDLIGKVHGVLQWNSFECKGRVSPPDAATKARAKMQAQRLVSVNGNPCTLHVGAITYLRGEYLQFHWRDPTPSGRPIEVALSDDVWRYYYGQVVDLLSPGATVGADTDGGPFVFLEEADVAVRIHPRVARPLLARDWGGAVRAAAEAAVELADAGFQADGIQVKAGPSWERPFEEAQAEPQ